MIVGEKAALRIVFLKASLDSLVPKLILAICILFSTAHTIASIMSETKPLPSLSSALTA